MFELTTEASLLATFRYRERRRVELSRDVTLPVGVHDYLTWAFVEGCPAVLRKDCVRRRDEARRAVPTIVFVAKDARGVIVQDVQVTMDGAAIDPVSTGQRWR